MLPMSTAILSRFVVFIHPSIVRTFSISFGVMRLLEPILTTVGWRRGSAWMTFIQNTLIFTPKGAIYRHWSTYEACLWSVGGNTEHANATQKNPAGIRIIIFSVRWERYTTAQLSCRYTWKKYKENFKSIKILTYTLTEFPIYRKITVFFLFIYDFFS